LWLHVTEVLFTGDHLYWDRNEHQLAAYRDYCWHSWSLQTESMQRLSRYSFEWVLPGHGQQVFLTRTDMREQMQRLTVAMRTS
jgi:glyoxylase-like metal-dependent hydrolase (beta-lactamase superfamily II)